MAQQVRNIERGWLSEREISKMAQRDRNMKGEWLSEREIQDGSARQEYEERMAVW